MSQKKEKEKERKGILLAATRAYAERKGGKNLIFL